jgi:site-specific recombinase XerD
MIRLLLDCGIRVSELCGLTVEGMDLDHGTAMVRGKGNKVRPVHFARGPPVRWTATCEPVARTAGPTSTSCSWPSAVR